MLCSCFRGGGRYHAPPEHPAAPQPSAKPVMAAEHEAPATNAAALAVGLGNDHKTEAPLASQNLPAALSRPDDMLVDTRHLVYLGCSGTSTIFRGELKGLTATAVH